jgi:DNA-binding NtrC family response regulator
MQRARFYRKVLVVDDELDVLRSVYDLLHIDYEVVTCQRASEALDHLKAVTDVAVILSDQRMPGMTGIELLQQARLIRPETTRLLFTAYADIHTVIDAINHGHVFRSTTEDEARITHLHTRN